MSETEIKVPNIGDFKDVEVIEVLVSEGQILQKNDPIITIESDKSSVEIPSNFEGKIKSLKIIARLLNKKDIEERKLPNQTTGLVITNIGKNSPVNYLNVGDVIIEAQKKKIKSIKDLEDTVEKALKSNQKTILFAIYNIQNQRRYIGVKLD